MFRHVVLIKFKPDVTPEQIEQLTNRLESVSDAIPQVRAVACGSDRGLIQGSSDFAIVVDFDSIDDYNVYLRHDDHVALAGLLGPLVESRAVVDYEFH
ncbi:Dabb family protein [Dactylosporangium sp. NPDC051484]|uniref:Dabb family protein n=1 Tax=Dactylosporangium sp. NPDC051484 TaxID=3154942 RepID=UPI00344BE3BC